MAGQGVTCSGGVRVPIDVAWAGGSATAVWWYGGRGERVGADARGVGRLREKAAIPSRRARFCVKLDVGSAQK